MSDKHDLDSYSLSKPNVIANSKPICCYCKYCYLLHLRYTKRSKKKRKKILFPCFVLMHDNITQFYFK